MMKKYFSSKSFFGDLEFIYTFDLAHSSVNPDPFSVDPDPLMVSPSVVDPNPIGCVGRRREEKRRKSKSENMKNILHKRDKAHFFNRIITHN